MDDAHAAQLAESGQRDPMDAFFDRPESRARPLTPSQEAHWRDDLAADRWGSTPRWSSQSVAALIATLDEARVLNVDAVAKALHKSNCQLHQLAFHSCHYRPAHIKGAALFVTEYRAAIGR